jgi:hypothetical protein
MRRVADAWRSLLVIVFLAGDVYTFGCSGLVL